MHPILVLLPVYNGSAFLRTQLDSVLTQSHADVYVLCRDDGSTDGSAKVLEQARQAAPERIFIVKDGLGNLGASANFALLLQHALDKDLPPLAAFKAAPYIALCDQDDIWHTDKLATCAAQLEALELAHPGKPALVHSDLRVVAQDGSEIAPSMARYQGLQTQDHRFNAQLLSNTLTGCTGLMNMQLVQQSLPIPPEAIMHDWWLSLVASAQGARHYIDQPLIDYRQHAGNAIGAKAHAGKPLRRNRIKRLFDNRHAEIFRLNAQQAAAFLWRFKLKLSLFQIVVLLITMCLYVPVPPAQRVIYRTLRRI